MTVAILLHNVLDLLNYAKRNAQVDTIAALYVESKDEMRIMLDHFESADEGVKRKLVQRARVLDSLSQVEKYKARFLGFAVTCSVLRTIAVTLFTLGIGLWSILRTAGVFVTVESYCPNR
jgi:hypothetical protein